MFASPHETSRARPRTRCLCSGNMSTARELMVRPGNRRRMPGTSMLAYDKAICRRGHAAGEKVRGT